MEKYNLGKSKAYNDKMKAVIPGGVHYNFRTIGDETSRHYVKGNNSRVWDMDGNEYLDLYAKFGAMILGHNNLEYNEKLKAQIDKVLAVNHTDLDYEVADMISKCIPSIEMVRFGLSGTEVVQNAIRVARAYTKKNRFIRFEGHYHGNMDNIIGGKFKDAEYPVPVEFPGDSRGTDGRAKGALEEQSFILPWNNAELLEKTLAKYHTEIAAIITEPVCINGGGVKPLPGYFEKMRQLCDRYNIVLILDEIITGFRVGLNGAQGLLGIKPDITLLGKALGGGMPISAFGGKKEIMKLYEERKVIHAGTFNGYPLGMAAVKASIEILSKNNGEIYQKLNGYAERLTGVFIKLAKDLGLPLTVQGMGAALVFHCCDKPVTGSEKLDINTEIKDSIISRCLSDYGVLISPVSRLYFNVLFSEGDIAFFEEHATAALKAAKAMIDEAYA